eukprot:gene4156-14254_t
MGFINIAPGAKPVHLVLSKDRLRSIKRGHPWIFPEVLVNLPKAPAGSLALLKDKQGTIHAKGYYDPSSKLAFRAFTVQKGPLNDDLVADRLERAAQMRQMLFSDPSITNGFRLVNGEGDGLPGLVIDIYGDVAVMKLDGEGAEAFYNVKELAEWLQAMFPNLKTCFQKSGDEEGRGILIWGEFPDEPAIFQENGVTFQADVVMGQKTGFFLDQRDNRARLGRLSKGRTVLNVFGYTGGFSIYAGHAGASHVSSVDLAKPAPKFSIHAGHAGASHVSTVDLAKPAPKFALCGFSIYAGKTGASHVTTVDLAKPALKFAEANWALNGLDASRHETEAVDAFVFLEKAVKAKQQWDVVVIDPPSFAPSQKAVEKAVSSYTHAFALAAQVTKPDGILALASCSSHISSTMFLELCEDALARARRQGYILGVHGQPEDHPYPIACEELRYLKFVMYRLEG